MASSDLFGVVPVSLSDLELWLFTVPRMAHYQRGRSAYLRNYQVIEKIQRAKVDGTFEKITGDAVCTFCGKPFIDHQPDFSPPVSPAEDVARLQRRVAVLEMVIASQAAATRIEALQTVPEMLRARIPLPIK